MIKVIVSDLSWTILFPKDPAYKGRLNDLYLQLTAEGKEISFFDYFRLDQDLLNVYRLFKDKVKLVIFTSGTIQENPELSMKLKEVFDEIISAKEFSSTAKNDSSVYLELVKKLGVKPDEIVLIDDDPDYVAAAKKSGCKTIKYVNASAAKGELQGLT